MKIADKTVVYLRYLIKNNKGETVENRMKGNSITYIHGVGNILAALENNLTGLEVGDVKIIYMSEENGFMGMDIEFSCEVIIDNVRLANKKELKRGKILQDYEEECGLGCIC